jgi:hypothetical protein
MVNASAKQETGKRTETAATQLKVFRAARLYSCSGAVDSFRARNATLLTSYFLIRTFLAIVALVRCGQSQQSRLELRLHLSRWFSGTDNLDTN